MHVILLYHSHIAYSNEADGKTQTGQEDAKDLEEFCHSTVTDSINPKNYAAEGKLRNGFRRYFKVGNFILEGLLFWRHFWQFFLLNDCVPTSHNVFSGMTPAKVKLF